MRAALCATRISIHALLAESDGNPARRPTGRRHFYPRSPCGERHGPRGSRLRIILFLSTLSLRRATSQELEAWHDEAISIHALLAESDLYFRDPFKLVPAFLSTLSLRRATYRRSGMTDVQHNFYPRSPCGERHPRARYARGRPIFLSTLSLRRATGAYRAIPQSRQHFYPRSPCGERHAGRNARMCGTPISIHALLAESDAQQLPHQVAGHQDFYPRSPCGERLPFRQNLPPILIFLSTLSLRRATTVSTKDKVLVEFLSTLSLRRATRYGKNLTDLTQISIHALLAESDTK